MKTEVSKKPKTVGKDLLLNGYMYIKSKQRYAKTHWECIYVRSKLCKARAVTTFIGGQLTVLKGPRKSPHNHAPNQNTTSVDECVTILEEPEESPDSHTPNEETGEEIVETNPEKHVEDEPELEPAQTLPMPFINIAPGVGSKLPERELHGKLYLGLTETCIHIQDSFRYHFINAL